MIFKLGHTYNKSDPQVYVKSEHKSSETDLLVFYLQALYNELVTEKFNLDLDEKDVADLLIAVYGFQPLTELEQRQAVKDKTYYYIDLYDNWERFCGYKYYQVLTDRKIHRAEVEPLLWQAYNRIARKKEDKPEVHLLTISETQYDILSIWFHETYFLDGDSEKQPLVFIRGLCPEVAETLKTFFPLAKISTPNPSIAIPLRQYPLSDYSYEWDGKHILITCKNEWQLRIRYEVDLTRDISFPIRTPFQLKQILLKMGYR